MDSVQLAVRLPQTISKTQLKMMIQAIGLDRSEPKRSRGGLYYYPKWNFYSAKVNVAEWNELQCMGYANQYGSVCYVTSLGLKLLSDILGIQIWNPVGKYAETVIAAVFEHICRVDAANEYWTITSCSECSEELRIPVHKVRKAMEELITKGLARKENSAIPNEHGKTLCFRGYTCTEKARHTSVYRAVRDKVLQQKRTEDALRET